MTEPTGTAVALHDVAPVQADRESNAATAAELLHHAIKSLVDFAYPTSIRAEYRLIYSKLSESRLACVLLGVFLIVSVAEYEQPGWFPRPDQLSSAIIGFLGACTLILPAVALFEYDDTHSWPWEDEGFVWPWQALLWSNTVYNEEIFDESTLACTHSYDVPNPLTPQARLDITVGDQGRELNVASSGTKSCSVPETSEEKDMVIPQTPLLLRGPRPALFSSPIQHRSGLLGPSPMPARFQFMNGKSVLEFSEQGDEVAA